MSEKSNPFEGFEPANTTPVPDILFDELMADLSNAELRALLYIIRRTYGFKKVADAISFNQFMEGIKTKDGRVLDRGCGVKNRTTLSKALASLEERKCISSSKGKDPLGDNMTTIYSIRFRAKEAQAGGSIKTVPPVVSKSYQGGNGNGLPVVSKSYPQQTVLQQTGKQNTDKQERDSIPTKEPANKPTTTPPTPNKNFNEKVEQFRTTFIALGKEMFAYDKFTTGKVQPNSEVAIRILEIIGDGEVSPEAMRRAFLKLWNHKDRDGTYWWRDKSKLTLKAFVNNYDDQEAQQEMSPYERAVRQSAGELPLTEEEKRQMIQAYASQPTINGMTNFAASGVRHIRRANNNTQTEQEAYESFHEDGLIYGKLPEYWTEERIEQVDTKKQISIRLLLDEWKKGQQLITTGPLAGQPRYDADPWM